jgi:hypothetical protein
VCENEEHAFMVACWLALHRGQSFGTSHNMLQQGYGTQPWCWQSSLPCCGSVAVMSPTTPWMPISRLCESWLRGYGMHPRASSQARQTDCHLLLQLQP